MVIMIIAITTISNDSHKKTNSNKKEKVVQTNVLKNIKKHLIPDNNESQHSSNQKNELDRGKNKLDGHLLGPKVHQNDTSERKAEMSLALRCFPGSVLHPQRQFTAFLEKLDLLYGLHGAFEEIHVQFLAKKKRIPGYLWYLMSGIVGIVPHHLGASLPLKYLMESF